MKQKIYTKTGDCLQTSTITKRVYKNDILIQISGSIDELQVSIMIAYNFIDDDEIKNILLDICKGLFTISYDICTSKSIISTIQIIHLENLIDKYEERLPTLTEFIIPGLTKSSSFIHQARTTCRRVERLIVEYAINNQINKFILQYINRLSDLLFVLARYIDKV